MKAGRDKTNWREQAKIVKDSLEGAELDFRPKINRRSAKIAGKRSKSVNENAGPS